MGDPLTTREALIAEVFKDLDAVLNRVDGLKADIEPAVQKAVLEAANSAYSRWKMGFESSLEDQRKQLSETARYAAALIGNELSASAERAASVARLIDSQSRRLLFYVVALAVGAGIVGGATGVALTHWLK